MSVGRAIGGLFEAGLTAVGDATKPFTERRERRKRDEEVKEARRRAKQKEAERTEKQQGAADRRQGRVDDLPVSTAEADAVAARTNTNADLEADRTIRQQDAVAGNTIAVVDAKGEQNAKLLETQGEVDQGKIKTNADSWAGTVVPGVSELLGQQQRHELATGNQLFGSTSPLDAALQNQAAERAHERELLEGSKGVSMRDIGQMVLGAGLLFS